MMHEKLFNISDLRRYGNNEKAGDTVPKSLNEKMIYIDGKERCYKISEVFYNEVSSSKSSKFSFYTWR